MPPKKAVAGHVPTGKQTTSVLRTTPGRVTRAQSAQPRRKSARRVHHGIDQSLSASKEPGTSAKKSSRIATRRTGRTAAQSASTASITPHKGASQQANNVSERVVDTPRPRGRPPKTTTAITAPTASSAAKIKQTAKKAAEATTTGTNASKPRGRPRKNTIEAVPSTTGADTTGKRKRDDAVAVGAPPRKRGRPSLANRKTEAKNPLRTSDKSMESGKSSTSGRPRGRPASKNTNARQKAMSVAKPQKVATSTAQTPKSGSKASGHAPKLTKADFPRKPRSPNKSEVTQSHVDVDISDAEDMQDMQYWLMKAEPEARMEKGIDVAFPIDKLAAATEPEPWDGKWHIPF